MIIAPVGIKLTNPKSRLKIAARTDYTSQTFPYNNDIFELKSNKLSKSNISFGSSPYEIAELFKYSGKVKMNEHFAHLKSKQPHLSDKIDKVKNFISELNETAKERGVELYFEWGKRDKHLEYDFDNMYYTFYKDNAWFSNETYSAFGTANELHELIHEADLIDQGRRLDGKERYFCEKAHNLFGTSPDFSIRGCVRERIIGDLKTETSVKDAGFKFRSCDENFDCLSRINLILGRLALDGKL